MFHSYVNAYLRVMNFGIHIGHHTHHLCYSRRHRLSQAVLAAASEVFAAMLDSEMKESQVPLGFGEKKKNS